MAKNHVFRAGLLAAGVALVGACAAQPEGSMLETRFQRAAKHYDVNFMFEGQRVYCKRGATRSMPLMNCVTEAHLRAHVEDERKLFFYFPPGSGATL